MCNILYKITLFFNEVVIHAPSVKKTRFNNDNGALSMNSLSFNTSSVDLHHWIPVLYNKWNFYNISWFHYPRLYIVFEILDVPCGRKAFFDFALYENIHPLSETLYFW